MASAPNTILVVGASRGLGLGLAREFLGRGWRVIATHRGTAEHLSALATQHAANLRLAQLDINLRAEAEAVAAELADERLTILFINAGVISDNLSVADLAGDAFNQVMVTNALSPLHMIELFAPRLVAPSVVGVMSSGLGSVTNNAGGGWDAYRASKAALNTLVRCRAARHRTEQVAHLAIAPGWVKTDTAEPGATLDVETSMRGVAEVLVSRIGSDRCEYLDYKGNTVAW